MIDKYLRNEKNFLIQKKDEDEIEKEYIKYLQRDFDPDEKAEIAVIDKEEDFCSEKNYIMKEEDENKQIEIIPKNSPREIRSSKSKLGFYCEINELDDDDIFSDRKIVEDIEKSSYKKDLLENQYLDYENIYLNEGKIKKNINATEPDLLQYEISKRITFKKEEQIPTKSQKSSDKLQSLLDNRNYFDDHTDNVNLNNFTNPIPSNSRSIVNVANNNNNSKTVDQEKLRKLTIDIQLAESKNETVDKPIVIFKENQLNYDEFESIKSYEKNDYKLKRLQEKIEEKLKEEYEMKIRKKEKEIEMKTKSEFAEAMRNLQDQLQNNLEEEKKKLEEDLQKKWDEKYQDLIVDCKAKLRDDKEQKLAANMYNKLKPIVEKEIYKKEYNKIEEKIRSELEEKFNKELDTKKSEEIEKAKKKLEYFTKLKIGEMESKLRNKCKEEVESELKKDIERKEKEIKINYMKKFTCFKNNLEKELKEEYERKKKELFREVNEIKSKVFRQKCSENLKLSKINKIKKSLVDQEMMQLKNAERLEKAMQSQLLSQNNFGNSKSFSSERIPNNIKSAMNQDYLGEVDSYNEIPINQNQNNLNKNVSLLKLGSAHKSIEKTSDQNINRNNRMLENVSNNRDIINRDKISKSRSKGKQSPNKYEKASNNAVNIFEINKKFKSPLNLNSSDLVIAQIENKAELSLIIKDLNNTNNINLKDSLNNLIAKNTKISLARNEIPQQEEEKRVNYKNETNYRLESPQRLSDLNKITQSKAMLNSDNKIVMSPKNINSTVTMVTMSPSSQFVKNINSCKNAQFSQNPLMMNCVSLKISENIPLTLIEFGKYLVRHIENEENYKTLYEKEFKKLKAAIQKIFQLEKLSDHCLFEYMLELWEKIEVSYEKRYKILNELCKNKANEVYYFLDKETEHLTNYFQDTKDVFQMIKNREKLKLRLQSKANKNELTLDDKEKFKVLTSQVEKNIKLIKEKFCYFVIWRGLQYEWLINYENWFYQQSK